MLHLFTNIMAAVTFLFGAPCSGKTRSSCQKWPGYVRISLDQLLEDFADLSLRQIITIHLIKVLKKGQCVVVDDCNHKKARRVSIVNLILQKLTGVRISCCVITPTFGLEQLLWRRELDIAQTAHLALNPGTDWMKIDQMIQNWSELAEVPSSDEGFKLEQHNTEISLHTPYKVELAGLFIQAESLYVCDKGEVKLVGGVPEAVNAWYSANPGGRCVLVQDGTTTPSVSTLEKESNLKHILKEIASKLEDCVIFLLYISSESLAGSYCIPPNPGILAYLSRLHLIDLDHKATMYWYQTSSHMKMAEKAGVKHIKASKVFSHTGLASSSHATVRPTIPGMLQTLSVCEPLPHLVQNYREGPVVPLFDLCTEDSGSGLVCEKTKCGRTLYLAYRDYSILQRYRNLYVENASDILCEEPSKFIKMSRDSNTPPSTVKSQNSTASLSETLSERGLPTWMLPREEKRKRRKKDGDTSQSENKGSKPKLKSVGSSTLYVMSEEELLDTARAVLQQSGEPVPSEMEVQLYLSQQQSVGGQSSREQDGKGQTSAEQLHKDTPRQSSRKTEESSRRRVADKPKKPETPLKRSRIQQELVQSMADVEDILKHAEGEKSLTATATHRNKRTMDQEEPMVASRKEASAKAVNTTNLDEKNSDEVIPGNFVGQSSSSKSGVSSGNLSFQTVPESWVANTLSSKSSSSRKNSVCTIPDSFVRDSSSSKSKASAEESGSKDVVVTDSYVKESGSSDRQMLPHYENGLKDSVKSGSSSKSSVRTVPDSFVKDSSSYKSKMSFQESNSKDLVVPDSYVKESGSSERQRLGLSANAGRKDSIKSSSSTKSSVRTVPDSFVKDSSSYKSKMSFEESSSKDAVQDSFVKESSSERQRVIYSSDVEIRDSFVEETPSIEGKSSSSGRDMNNKVINKITETPLSGERHVAMETDLSILDDLI